MCSGAGRISSFSAQRAWTGRPAAAGPWSHRIRMTPSSPTFDTSPTRFAPVCLRSRKKPARRASPDPGFPAGSSPRGHLVALSAPEKPHLVFVRLRHAFHAGFRTRPDQPPRLVVDRKRGAEAPDLFVQNA